MDEILVHISTPATRQYDELYNSLANAYIVFEPYQNAHVDGPEAINERGGIHPSVSQATTVPNLGNMGSALMEMPTSNWSGNSYGSFPSQISSTGHLEDANESYVQNSLEELVGPDSLRPASRLGQLERIQVKWQRSRSLQGIARNQRPSNVKSAIRSGSFERTFIEDTQLAAQIMESQLYEDGSTTSEDTPEEEPAGYSQTRASRPNELRNPPPTTEISSQKSPILCHVNPEVSSSTGPLSPLHEFPVTVSSVTNGSCGGGAPGFDTPPTLVHFSDLPFEVFAPAPKISVENPGRLPTQVTPYLRAIQVQNPTRFKPSEISRDLEADERGYWLVEGTNWPPEAQYSFWSSLSKHVHDGDFGWGVTLCRDSVWETTLPQAGLGPIRLYSWGEIVEHLWLSLWLCSNGRIVGSGAQWFDAEDNVVVRVP